MICKSCGSEVSPYITECPYCGNRLRKRAPKLDRDQRVAERKARRQPPPLLSRLKRDEIPGIRGDTRPYATIALVVAGLVGCLLWRTNLGGSQGDLIVFGQPGSEWWRLFTAAFTYDNVGYAMITLGTVGLFGWLLERRHGPFPVLALFIIGGVGGLAATDGDRSQRGPAGRPGRRAGARVRMGDAGPADAALRRARWTATSSALPSSRWRWRSCRSPTRPPAGCLTESASSPGSPSGSRWHSSASADAQSTPGPGARGATPIYDPARVPERAYTDAELDAAIAELTDPTRLQDAQDIVMRAAPSLQRVLAAAIAEGGWFDAAHEQAVREAAGEAEGEARLRAVKTLLVEETRLGMLVGVAVGFELSRALQRTDPADQQED